MSDNLSLVLLRELAQGAAPRVEGVMSVGTRSAEMGGGAFRDAGRGDLHLKESSPGELFLLSPEAIRQYDSMLRERGL